MPRLRPNRYRLLPQPEPLRAVRRGLGLTQSELALRLGVDSGSVSRWERGTRLPPAWLPLALAGLRGVLWRESMGRIAALTMHHAAVQERAEKSRAGVLGNLKRWGKESDA